MRKTLMAAAALLLTTTSLLADECGVLCEKGWWETATVLEINSAIAAANPSVQSANEFTLLHLAIMFGTTENIKTLVKNGADPNAPSKRGKSLLQTASMFGSPETILALIQAGADPNAPSPNGSFPLSRAVGMNSLENVVALVRAGADVNISGKRAGFSALFRAIAGRNTEIVAFYLTRGQIQTYKTKLRNKPHFSWRSVPETLTT